MKPLTKTVARRVGGLAAQIVKAPPPEKVLTKGTKPKTPNSAAVKRSRDKNTKYRDYQREYMRKLRAKAKKK